ncbi:11199_t:CDS:10 [Acaulospora colombiana]|uniref:11199_t:CDS:1 n=1 Tax=Acaulospora colombiana TaxID=27376 RepID=A0ACA9KVS8_9GLOM|nr:11199_t:CDS:10 [Acaulospora colombiana]
MFAPRSSRPATVAAYPQKNGLRRKKKGESAAPAIELERILGFTTSKPTALATAPARDLIAYAAGSVVVLYNHKKNKQVGFLHASSSTTPAPQNPANTSAYPNRHTIAGDAMINPLGALGILDPQNANSGSAAGNSKKTPVSNKAKPISCIAFSPDGNYLAVGEIGHQPRILIWDVEAKTLIAELKGHKHGVLALRFSPNMKWIVSLGFQHDGYLNVWNWKNGTKVACNKITTKVYTLAFNRNGSYFVTAGLRHVKFWYFDASGNLPKKSGGQSITKTAQVLDGRSGILGDLKDNNFLDAACCQKTDNTYLVTSNGLLCMFTEGRLMDKWVNLQVCVKGAYSIDVSEQYIVCACANGIVRLFEPVTLKYLGTLPKPHPLGVDLTIQMGTTYNGVGGPNDVYPDTLALKLDAETGKLTCVYSDRSLFIWDIKDVKKIGKYRSFLYHYDVIWGVEMMPIREESTTVTFPENTFVTYSADNTIRFWNLDGTNSAGAPAGNTNGTSTAIKKNIYSKECIKIVYVDPDGSYRSRAVVTKNDQPDSTDQSAQAESGIRTLRISPDGKLIASGDRGGNLRVHDLDTFDELTYQEAHDAEILTIEFTDGRIPGAPYLIATASRDRILHVFDINNNYQLIQTLDDHSSSITAIKFTNDGGRLISCGADKSIIFRSRQNTNNSSFYVTYHNISGRATVFDMDIDISNRYVSTVSGERRLNVYQIESGKSVRSYKSDMPDEVNAAEQGSLLRISLDPGGVCAVTAGSDKSIRLFDFTNGTILRKVLGHSELITGVKFTPDCERVISTSADGCIYVWKLSDELVSKMRQKWLERSGFNAQVGSPPVVKDYLSPQSSTPSTIHPKTVLPAQRPQSLMFDLQQCDDSSGQEQDFYVRRSSGGLKAKKSYSSMTAADTQNEDNAKKVSPALKRPVSFTNDGTSQAKPPQLQISRSVSDFSQTRIPTTKSPPPVSPVGASLDTSSLATPPNTPTTSSGKRESWKIGLPSWAKKAFKEKEGEKVAKDNEVLAETDMGKDDSNVNLMHEDADKKSSIGTKSLNRAKSQSKLRQDSTKLFLGVEPDSTSLPDNVSLGESPVSMPSDRPPNLVVDDIDEEEDEEANSPEEDSNEDAETIFVESQGEESEEFLGDGENVPTAKRRRSSFVGSIKTMEFAGDRPKSPSGSEKEVEADLETYLTTRAEDENGSVTGENDDYVSMEHRGRKRQSLTTKFYSVSQRRSQDSGGRNSLSDSLLKLAEESREVIKKDLRFEDDHNGVEKALKALEGKNSVMVSQEIEASNGNDLKLLESSEVSTTLSSNLPTKNTAEVHEATIDESNVESIEKVGNGLGIVVSEEYYGKKTDIGVDDDAPVTRNSTINTSASDDQINEDAIMNDVLTMTVLLERTLIAYKKAASSNNESMTKLISDSLVNMMDDIKKSIGVGNDDDYGEIESNNSYNTAITTHSYTANGNGSSTSLHKGVLLSPLASPPPTSKSFNQLSEGATQNLLEKYSDLLLTMVEEKLTAKAKSSKTSADELGNDNSTNNANTTASSSPVLTFTNASSSNTASTNGRPVKSRNTSGGIRNKASRSRFVR